MNTDGTGFYTCKECHQTESLWNHITTDHKEEERLEHRRKVGENSCNSGDGTVQKVQSLMCNDDDDDDDDVRDVTRYHYMTFLTRVKIKAFMFFGYDCMRCCRWILMYVTYAIFGCRRILFSGKVFRLRHYVLVYPRVSRAFVLQYRIYYISVLTFC